VRKQDYPATPVEFATLALGTFRIVRLIGVDDFPPVKAVRNRLIKRFGEDHLIVEAASCPWCASWYLGAFTMLSACKWPWVRKALLVPALSAAAGLLSSLDEQ
jgi:hypothetical protein